MDYLQKFPVHLMLQLPLPQRPKGRGLVLDQSTRFVIATRGEEVAMIGFTEIEDCHNFIWSRGWQDKVRIIQATPDGLQQIALEIKQLQGMELSLLIDSSNAFSGFLIPHGQLVSRGTDGPQEQDAE